ncbi:YraN family protein [Arcanobacterium ihumii]|uniref:YraN family protein n=1 Tax=Arcanobacterium ihumii TaxID=2138162 RepID=UPI000F53EC30|nr:YraN family protein [Arcanobacterium ihumii]
MLNESIYVENPSINEILGCSRQDLGRWGERCAQRYLEQRGFIIRDTNWRSRGGEIDLIAFDPTREAYVAIEVKTRRQNRTGTPEESITGAKLHRIRSLLVQWVVNNSVHAQNLAVDVVGVRVLGGGYSITHIKDAS